MSIFKLFYYFISVKKLTYAEYTRMILNADNWMKTKEELSTKPRKIDVY